MISAPRARTALFKPSQTPFTKFRPPPRSPWGKTRFSRNGRLCLSWDARPNEFHRPYPTLGEKAWAFLREPLRLKRTKPPVNTTFSRNLAYVSVEEFQAAFGEFLNAILAESNDTLTAAVDGKAAKAMIDENGDPLLMLHVFVHDLKVTLDQWSVRGDKTNEPGCLKSTSKRYLTPIRD